LQDVVTLDNALQGKLDKRKQASSIKPLTLHDALTAYECNRGPEHRALIRLAQVGAPFQVRIDASFVVVLMRTIPAKTHDPPKTTSSFRHAVQSAVEAASTGQTRVDCQRGPAAGIAHAVRQADRTTSHYHDGASADPELP
jgi:hypothetical protein